MVKGLMTQDVGPAVVITMLHGTLCQLEAHSQLHLTKITAYKKISEFPQV